MSNNKSPQETKEEKLDRIHWAYVKEKGVACIHSETFPAAYKEQAALAMEEYSNQRVREAFIYMLGDETQGNDMYVAYVQSQKNNNQ